LNRTEKNAIAFHGANPVVNVCNGPFAAVLLSPVARALFLSKDAIASLGSQFGFHAKLTQGAFGHNNRIGAKTSMHISFTAASAYFSLMHKTHLVEHQTGTMSPGRQVGFD
jgi:hypothetical protein